MSQSNKRTKVFISYSEKDKSYAQRLLVHLEPYIQREGLDVFSMSMIGAGELWEQKILDALQCTRVAVLLVSADFQASKFIQRVEVKHLLDAANSGEVDILIVAARACDWLPELSRIQGINPPKRSLDKLRKEGAERVYLTTVRRILEIIRQDKILDKSPSNLSVDRHADQIHTSQLPFKKGINEITAQIRARLDIVEFSGTRSIVRLPAFYLGADDFIRWEIKIESADICLDVYGSGDIRIPFTNDRFEDDGRKTMRVPIPRRARIEYPYLDRASRCSFRLVLNSGTAVPDDGSASESLLSYQLDELGAITVSTGDGSRLCAMGIMAAGSLQQMRLVCFHSTQVKGK